jgi:hypothetical protein
MRFGQVIKSIKKMDRSKHETKAKQNKTKLTAIECGHQSDRFTTIHTPHGGEEIRPGNGLQIESQASHDTPSNSIRLGKPSHTVDEHLEDPDGIACTDLMGSGQDGMKIRLL